MTSSPRSQTPVPGFALVITLSLMVLLTVLAIGLMSLSSISLRASTRGDAMAAARANARIALMMAIGELQQAAGPDQRATATADLAGTSSGSDLGAGAAPANNGTVNNTQKGLTAVQPGTRHWTGVWRNANTTNPGTEIFTKTPSPTLLTWLVSGNENTNAGSRVSPSSSNAAVGSDGGPSDPAKAVVLVGRNSIGSGAVDRYVSAPLVEISNPSDTTGPAAGRHAWWIGDEGVKAKLNLLSPPEAAGPLTEAELAAPRRGWEVVDGFGSYPIPGSGQEASLAKVITTGEAELLDASFGAGSDAPLQRAFHSATTDSFGVLADVLQGGLKLDFSAYLDGTMPTAAIAGIPNSPASNVNIIPTAVTNRIRGPKWSSLKEFRDLGAGLDPAGLTVRTAANDTKAAISPAIIELRLLLGAKLVAAGPDSYRVQPCAKVAIALANPYPFPLRWTSPLELEIKNATDPARQPSRIWPAAGKPAFVPRDPSEPAVFNNAVFTIASGTLQPGEAKAYTQASPAFRVTGSIAKVTIPLTDFSTSNPTNFSNSVILDHGSTNSVADGKVLLLDVREDTNTTLINAELRLAGSTAILRRVERFELDNAPFDVIQRKINSTNARQFTEPFPLQLYNFQLSQPGVDYGSILANPGQLGLRSSTMRTFADYNLQATRFRKPIISYNPPPYFMQIANSAATLPFSPPGGNTGTDFTRDLALSSALPWGRSAFDARRTVLFSPPKSLVSIAQFQHADLTADDFYVSVGHQPGNAVGNSYATPFVSRARTVQNRSDFTLVTTSSATAANTNYYDLSYLLNAALWDTYYFSTIPRNGSPVPLNPRIVKTDASDTSPNLRDGQLAASRLMVDGAFNVNSVSKDAWKALLAGSKHLGHPADGSASGDALFPRSLGQPDPAATPPSGTSADSFSGFRRLTDAQIDRVAEEITRQVRLRGPFVSLSQFVNRAIVPLTQSKELGRSGALQSALDLGGVNISPDGSLNAFTGITIAEDRMNLQAEGSAPRADLVGSDTTMIPNSGPDGIWPTSSHDLNPGAVAGILADRPMLTDPAFRSEQGFRSTGIPGWLTQADLLQVIGPSLAPRSDTFRIRAYGEALDPATGNPIAKAWCEAVVQRLPDYVDPSDSPTERGASLTSINQRFGRRFALTSFRWLSPHEI